jgi:hypothetical protein
MTILMRATILAAATAAATLFAQPVLSATVQPRLIVSDVGETAKIVDVVGRRGGWGHRGGYWHRGGWGHRGWGHRGWGHRGWGWRRGGWGYRRWGWGGPRFYGGYGCPWGYRWSYRWGCVPYRYGRPVITFGFGYGGWW